MSAQVLDDARAAVRPRARRRPAGGAPAYTSIRALVATRDKLATFAAEDGLGLSASLDDLVNREWKARALAELRQERIEAFADPAFVAEMREWDEADDGTRFDDDGWPEFNG